LSDSFQDNLLAPPLYTRPETFKNLTVPMVLTNGNHKLIDEWRFEQSVIRTETLRPDLLKNQE
jgi:tRNA (guanine37-N1)-methyltransferase